MVINDTSTNSTKFAVSIRRFGIIAIIVTAVFLLGYQYSQHLIFNSYKEKNSIVLTNEDITNEEHDFNYRVKGADDPFEETFYATISQKDVDKISDDYVTLFTPYPQAESFQIFINGTLVGVDGDISEGRSNLWADHYYFSFEKSILDKDVNTLEITMFSRYMSGGIGNPFMIVGYSDSSMLRNTYGFNLHGAINAINIALIIITMLVAFTVPVDRYKFLLMIGILVVMIFSYRELTHISDTMVRFIIYKKIAISANIFVVGLATMLFRYMLGYTKRRIPILVVSILAALIPALLSPTMQIYKSIYDITFIFSVLIAVYWSWIAFRRIKTNMDAKIILTFSLTFTIYVLLWLMGELLYQGILISVTSILLPLYMIFVVVYVFIEIHEERSLKESFESMSQEYQTMFNNSQSGILFTKGDNVIQRMNERGMEILGFEKNLDITKRNFSELLGLDDNFQEFRRKVLRELLVNGSCTAEQLIKDSSGLDLWIKVSGKAIDASTPPDLSKGIVWVFDDISDRKKAELKLKEIAARDHLTGIRNRRDFEETTEAALKYHKRYKRSLCFLMLDIDKFKVINDTYGHSVGDQSLILLTEICSKQIREQDIFGRIGGEEFAIALVEINKELAFKVAERIRKEVQRISGESDLPSMTISIGLAESKPDSTVQSLVKEADINLYKAKEGGRNLVVAD